MIVLYFFILFMQSYLNNQDIILLYNVVKKIKLKQKKLILNHLIFH